MNFSRYKVRLAQSAIPVVDAHERFLLLNKPFESDVRPLQMDILFKPLSGLFLKTFPTLHQKKLKLESGLGLLPKFFQDDCAIAFKESQSFQKSLTKFF